MKRQEKFTGESAFRGGKGEICSLFFGEKMLVSYGERLVGAWIRAWREHGENVDIEGEVHGGMLGFCRRKNRDTGLECAGEENCFTGCFTQ